MEDYKSAIFGAVEADDYISVENLRISEAEGGNMLVLTGKTSTFEGRCRVEAIANSLGPTGFSIKNNLENDPQVCVIKSAEDHNSPKRMSELWNIPGAFEIYEKGKLNFYRELAELISSNNAPIDGGDLIDIGCGLGHLLISIGSQYRPKSLSGTELAEPIVRKTSERLPNARIFVHDIQEQALDVKYDAIFCTEVLEHLFHPEKAVCHMIEALKPAGVLFMILRCAPRGVIR